MNSVVETDFLILALNPGSTSTKIALYANEREIFSAAAAHSVEELQNYASVMEQLPFRLEIIKKMLTKHQADLKGLSAIAGRGGVVKPIESGTYIIDEEMLGDLKLPAASGHASALGAFMAHQLGRELNVPAYIVDPVVVDELSPVARLSGHPDFPRSSIFHALNHKAVARRCAADLGLDYECARLIVAHLGGGITVGAHCHGRVVDVNNGLLGDGPFSPERCGGLQVADVIKAAHKRQFSLETLLSITNKKGGLAAYLGTNDLRDAEKRIEAGDSYAALVVEAMAYQVAKEIGAMAAALEGKVDAIAITGGLAKSFNFVRTVSDRVRFVAPIRLYPGEKELEALALGVLRVLVKHSEPKRYGSFSTEEGSPSQTVSTGGRP